MTARLEPLGWVTRVAFLSFAAMIGLLAGYWPEGAVIATVALAFVVMTMADLRVGLAMFVVVIFIETAQLAPGLGLAKVAGAAVAFSWLAVLLTDPGSRRFLWSDHPGLTVILVTLLTWMVLSITWAADSSAAIDMTMRYALSAALFPIAYTAIRTTSDLRLVVGAFVVGAAGSALLGIVSPPGATNPDAVQRLTSTIGDPNEFAATLVAGIVLSLALFAGARRGSLARALLATAALACLLAMVFTASRGGVVALGAALLVAPFLSPFRARALAASIAIATIVVIYAVTFAPTGTFDRLQERDGGSGRTDIWSVAWRVIEDRPVTGVGVGNFPGTSVDYVIQPGALHDKRTLIAEPSVAHNIYLETWAEMGIVGLILFATFLAICVGAAIVASFRFRRRGDSASAILAGGIAVAVIALLTAYFFLSEQTGNKLWLLLALGPVALSLARSQPHRDQAGQRNRDEPASAREATNSA